MAQRPCPLPTVLPWSVRRASSHQRKGEFFPNLGQAALGESGAGRGWSQVFSLMSLVLSATKHGDGLRDLTSRPGIRGS